MKDTTRSTPSWTSPTSIVTVLASGAMFGLAMNKGNVHLPSVIQGQMTLERFTMMKMFLAALGTSGVSMASFRALYPEAFKTIQNKRACNPSNALVLGTGGLLLGAGMTLSGSCPGSVYVQMGAGIPTALPVFLGVIGGTLGVSVIKPMIQDWQESKIKVNSTLGLSTFGQATVGLLLVGASLTLELFIPEQITSNNWYPSAAGIVVGLIQLPMMFLLEKSLGATASYKILLGESLSCIRDTVGCKLNWIHSPLLSDKSTLLFAIGIVAGSALATQGLHSEYNGELPSTLAAAIGGTLIGMGANIAGGCTSGHGLSGVSLLMKSSSIVLPCIFIGAMGTAFLLRSLNMLLTV